jgi:hypothetical protein
LVISGNSEATDLAEAKLLWDLSSNAANFYYATDFFFLIATGVGALRVSNGAK